MLPSSLRNLNSPRYVIPLLRIIALTLLILCLYQAFIQSGGIDHLL